MSIKSKSPCQVQPLLLIGGRPEIFMARPCASSHIYANKRENHNRGVLLLLASYYFYMSWKAEYLLLIVLSTLIDYYAALRMSQTTEQSRRKKLLWLSLFSNLGVLFGFKYFNFFSDSVTMALNQFNIFYQAPAFELLLPVGISFYTFQRLTKGV